jgi:TatD DNase family protein
LKIALGKGNPVELIDTHAHLDDERFQADLPQVLERARQAGLVRIITVATTGPTSLVSVDLARRYSLLKATVGIQPNHAAQAGPADWDQVVELVNRPEVVGLGETGLDRYWDHTPFAQQEEYFARHLDLSRKTGLPLVIHCREAEVDLVRMLREDFNHHGLLRGVMHSFTADLATAQACLEMGLYISFAGMVTYKNAQDLRHVASQVPLDRLLIETDSPYLAPVPVRGKRNEPAFVKHSASHLAQVLGIPVESVAEHTTRNARELFSAAR